MEEKKLFECPHCHNLIDVNEVYAKQFEEIYNRKYQQKLEEEKRNYQKEFEKLAELQKQLEMERKTINEQINNAVIEKIKVERAEIENQLRKSINYEQT